MNLSSKGVLLKQLLKRSISYLKNLEEPQPPLNWVRELPKGALPDKFYNQLNAFFRSAQQHSYDYQALQTARKDMEYALRHADLDIRTETVRKGSPHTLRIFKTQKSYEKAHHQWELDMKQLSELQGTK